jgi:uncharacterized protein YdiU (UPF0061 family)
VPLLGADPNTAVDQATAVLERFEGWFREAHGRGLAAKLGIPLGERAGMVPEAVHELGAELFALLEAQRVDHTAFFRALGEDAAAALFAQPESFDKWRRRLEALRGQGPSADDARSAMSRMNPVLVPRNVHLDAALRSAHLGDLEPVRTMLEAVRRPFERRPEHAHLEGPGEGGERFLTFCGT